MKHRSILEVRQRVWKAANRGKKFTRNNQNQNKTVRKNQNEQEWKDENEYEEKCMSGVK